MTSFHGQRPPDGARAVRVDRVQGGGGARLGEAVALEHERAARIEELQDVAGDRRGARQPHLESVAEQPPDP
jgi:hypothetical protein